MGGYVGAIDQGTTSSRFIIFDRRGIPVAAAAREHRQITPEPGLVEHDPLEIWHNTQAVIGLALQQAGMEAADLDAIGVANQRETTLLWDSRTGLPLHNALVWQDARVELQVAELIREGGKDRFRAKTGLPVASYFSALKLRWLLDYVPDARAKAASGDALFGTVDSWLIWQLTGGPDRGLHLTDVTNASRTQLMDLATLEWDDGLLASFEIPRACLPQIRSSSEIYGTIRVGALAGAVLAGDLGDQQAALFGQACLQPGEVKNTYGTGCFMLMNTGGQAVSSTAGLLTTVAYRLGDAPPVYALEGSVANAGSLVQWLRDNLRIIGSSAEIEALAQSVPDNGDVYIVPAFSGLYAPYWQEHARGIIAGLTRFAGRGHIARAALEAVAYQVRDVLEAMGQDSGLEVKILRTDGGMVVNETLMQFQADILGVELVRAPIVETTSLGAAYAAGLAVGYWSGTDEIIANRHDGRHWLPSMPEDRRARYYASWKKAVSRSLGWLDP